MLPGKIYTPDVVLEVAWRHRWVILVPLIAGAAGTAVYSNSLPDVFRSETMILVVPQRIPESYVRSTVTTQIEDRLRSISEQIRSRTRLEQLIVEFDLYPQQRAIRPMEEIVEMMDRKITVETVRGDSFRIAFEAEDAMIPVKVTTRLAQMFIEENQRDRTATAEDTNQFLESQLADAKARLLEHERKLEVYRLRHAGELPSQLGSNLQVLQSTQTQLQSLAEFINRDRDRRLLLEKSLTDARGLETTGGDLHAVGEVRADPLEVARRELRSLEARLTPNHPDLIAKRRAVEQLEESRAASGPALAAPSEPAARAPASARDVRARQIQDEIDRLDQQLQAKEAETARLQAIARDYQRRIEAVPSRETEMIELMRDYQTLQGMYTSLLGRKEDSNIAANLERRKIGEQFKVLDPARPAERPFSPNRIRMNLTGALFGLLAGLGLGALLEYRDTSLRTEDDVVRTLSLPVLAVVPLMESPRERRRRIRRMALVSAAGVLALVVVAGAVASEWGWLS